MAVHNSEIAEIFAMTADLLEISDANPFRVRAYRNAARLAMTWPQSLSQMVRSGETLSRLPGIGRDLASKIEEIARTGELQALQELKRNIPAALSELLKLTSLGPKRVKTLHDKLNIDNLADLERAAKKGKIHAIAGFGKKTEEKILEELARYAGLERRHRLSTVREVAEGLAADLRKIEGVEQVTVAGSYRRLKETVGDLDIVVTGTKAKGVSAAKRSKVMERFTCHEDVNTVLARGTTRSSVILRSGLQVDLRVVPPESYGAAMLYFTGSKDHNIALRTMAVKKNLKINEYGVFRGKRKIAGRTEKEIYALFDLPYIPPELRENRGEIEAATQGKLPKLITIEDIRGDLHSHTTASDGRLSLEEMARAAEEAGYEYLAVTDHTKHTTVAGGLDARRMRRHLKAIERVNSKMKHIQLLKSAEVDILENGKLDLPNDVLGEMDLTVCSVHSNFKLPREKQTERIIRAMDNRYFNILGHPIGRIIGGRSGYDVDVETLLAAARERGCFLELNSQPDRLDLSDIHCKLAKEMGVKIAISTDAHSDLDFRNLTLGIGQARRGWLSAGDVLNTRPLVQLLKLLNRR